MKVERAHGIGQNAERKCRRYKHECRKRIGNHCNAIGRGPVAQLQDHPPTVDGLGQNEEGQSTSSAPTLKVRICCSGMLRRPPNRETARIVAAVDQRQRNRRRQKIRIEIHCLVILPVFVEFIER